MSDQIKLLRLASLVRDILTELGENVSREGLLETPQRVARWLMEGFSHVGATDEDLVSTVKVFTDQAVGDQVVAIREVSFASICEHHLLPFSGVAHVAYIPNEDGKITGLSKVGRVLDKIAARPQVQERLTAQLFRVIDRALSPRALLVVVEASHACMTCRGAKKLLSLTSTQKFGGSFASNSSLKSSAFDLLRRAA